MQPLLVPQTTEFVICISIYIRAPHRHRGGGLGGEGVGLVGGVRLDVNAMLGVGGDVGYGGCEPRIEGIVQCTKRYCTILRK